MANVVRDPREHPDAIIPDLKTNNVAPFTLDQVAFVYGSKWKQRYFTRIGDDYYPLPVQWDVGNKTWRPYHVADTGADWWTAYYPSRQSRASHRANVRRLSLRQLRHPGQKAVGVECRLREMSRSRQRPRRAALAREHFQSVAGRCDRRNDTCIQCHSQGQPRGGLIDGKAYDWPVGYHVGLRLQDYWKLEPHTLGETSFTHFADGTAHKNRMQGNDFVQSVMYRRGVTCASCHDVHGTENQAQLRKPTAVICLDCHAPGSPNGPHAATVEDHTHHAKGSAGGECVACHMPKIEQTIANVNVRSHTFKFITPTMSDQLKIPNACTGCHTDRSNEWATEALRGWTGISPWRAAQ